MHPKGEERTEQLNKIKEMKDVFMLNTISKVRVYRGGKLISLHPPRFLAENPIKDTNRRKTDV